jgi:hypothetical protein
MISGEEKQIINIQQSDSQVLFDQGCVSCNVDLKNLNIEMIEYKGGKESVKKARTVVLEVSNMIIEKTVFRLEQNILATKLSSKEEHLLYIFEDCFSENPSDPLILKQASLYSQLAHAFLTSDSLIYL